MKPHSQAWYADVARHLGGYHHPWQRALDGPDPEAVFGELLEQLLTPSTRVLEAGCGHGPDAVRFGAQVARWVGYDFTPDLLRLAEQNVPQAEFFLWDGRAEPPAGLGPPFDLIVSRRGPTSVILHLPALAAPEARFLYVGHRRGSGWPGSAGSPWASGRRGCAPGCRAGTTAL